MLSLSFPTVGVADHLSLTSRLRSYLLRLIQEHSSLLEAANKKEVIWDGLIFRDMLYVSRVAAGIVSQMVLWVITSNVTVYACN